MKGSKLGAVVCRYVNGSKEGGGLYLYSYC